MNRLRAASWFSCSPTSDINVLAQLINAPSPEGACLIRLLFCRFAVAWYPIYCIPDAPLNARFLTFHTLQPQPLAGSDASSPSYLSLPVVGLCWCNLQQENWMAPTAYFQDISHPGSCATPDVSAYAAAAAAFELDMRLEELQATAKRMGRGIGLKHLGPRGFGPIRHLRHPDFDYFQSRQ